MTIKISLILLWVFSFSDFESYSQSVFPSFEDHPQRNVQRSIQSSLPGPVFILSYHFAPIGAEWYYNCRESMQGPETGYYLIKSVEDTIVDSKMCRVLSHMLVNSKGISFNDGQSILYQDSTENKVYRYLYGNFYLLYDFTKETGDTIIIKEPLSATQYDSIITVVDSVGIEIISDSIHLRSFYVRSVQGRKYDFEGKIIENIGNLLFLFPFNQLVCDSGCPMPLRCYNDNEISFTSNEPYVLHVPCDFIYTSSISDEIPEFKIYPNPFNGEITTEYPGIEPFTIEILNSGGQKVFENNVSSLNRFHVNLSAFPAGVYFVKAITGKKVSVQKIIKH